jgi:hypothetical protein
MPESGDSHESGLHERLSSERHRIASGWHRLGKLAAEQAIPIAVGLVSLIIAVNAWLEARPQEFEKARALASVETESTIAETANGENTTVTSIKITNTGDLTFAIIDLHVEFQLVGGLSAPWTENSLLDSVGSALPIGLRPFKLEDGHTPQRGRFQFDGKMKSWHVVDPGRTVTIMDVQPVRGAGRMAVLVDVFAQPLKLEDVANAITGDQVVNGVHRPTMPEYGVGEVATSPVYPYTSGYILIIPKTH